MRIFMKIFMNLIRNGLNDCINFISISLLSEILIFQMKDATSILDFKHTMNNNNDNNNNNNNNK